MGRELQATSVAELTYNLDGLTIHTGFRPRWSDCRKDSIENNPPATQTNGYFEFLSRRHPGRLERTIKFWQDERFAAAIRARQVRQSVDGVINEPVGQWHS